jgi:hypothetical protein
VGALKASIGSNDPRPWIEIQPDGVADPSPAGIVAYLASRGVSLSLRRGRLVARSEAPINIVDRQLMDRAEPLLIGELGGSKPLCSECSNPATTVVLPRAPMCDRHAQ